MPILPDQLFNRDWYLTQNPDVADAIANNLFDSAWEHFQQYGKAEGRDPGPIFDTQYYLSNNPDVNEAVSAGLTTAYDHFIAYGAAEARSVLSLFSPEFYLAQNPDVAAAVEAGLISATEHFLLFGQNEPRYISPFLNLGAYLDANADVKAAVDGAGVQPLGHLLTFGFAEGRDLGNGVDLALFVNDPTFQQAIEQGDVHAAMNRVGEVAPFLPSFRPPANWVPSSNTPIPVDFIPPEGVKLVVPPGVEVPPGMVLPDTFEPITPPDSGSGGEPTPDPDAQGALKIIGVAGRATGEDGQYQQGDSIIIAFSHAVVIDEARFDEQTLAKFGEGFTLTPVGIEEVFPNGVPDWAPTLDPDRDVDEVLLMPAAQYRLTFGDAPALAVWDSVIFKAGSVAFWSDEEGELLLTDANLEFSATGSGTMILTGPLGNPNTSPNDNLSLNAFLAHDVNYELAAGGGSGNLVALANLGGREKPVLQYVKGSEAADIFVAFGQGALFGQIVDELYSGLVLDGGEGRDQLLAVLDVDSPNISLPSIQDVEVFYFTTSTQWNEEPESPVTLSFGLVSGVETVWNLSPGGHISLTDVQHEIELGAFNTGYDYTEYSVVYAESASVTSQRLNMVDAFIDKLNIGIDGESQLSELSIGIFGHNILDFVSGEIKTISVENGPLPPILEGFFYEECGCGEPSLGLGHVWDGLTIDITGLKGNGANYVDLQLGWVEEFHGTLTIVLGDEPSSGSSDLMVQLMNPSSIASDSHIIIQNASVAGVEAGGAPNDVLTVAGLTQKLFLSSLECLKVTADDSFVDFSFLLPVFGDDVGTFTLTLDNLLSQAAYEALIEEVVETPDNGYGVVGHSAAEYIVAYLFEGAKLFQEWSDWFDA